MKLSRHNLADAIACLPIFGIIAFALCSVNAVAHFLLDHAQHPAIAYWLAAILVEGFTAWLIASAVETLHKLLASRGKRDRRFNGIILCAYVVLAIPTLAVSFFANRTEFGGNGWLGILFPSLCVSCAVGGAVPAAIARHERRKGEEKVEAARKRAERETQKAQRATRVAPIAASDAKKTATIADWREICASLDGNRAVLRADGVEAAVIGAGLAPPSRRTMQNWAREARAK